MRQVQAAGANFGEITKADGVNLTVTLDDGTETSVTAAGNRFVGAESKGLVIGGLFL